MSYEAIALTMSGGMLLMLLSGQRIFAAIGFVSAAAALSLYGNGAIEMPFNAAFKLFNWYPMLTLPLFIYMGYILSESGIADDLYGMFHVWFGPVPGGLALRAVPTISIISAPRRKHSFATTRAASRNQNIRCHRFSMWNGTTPLRPAASALHREKQRGCWVSGSNWLKTTTARSRSFIPR